MNKTLTQMIRNTLVITSSFALCIYLSAKIVHQIFKDTNMDLGYEVRGNSVEFYDGGIMHPQHTVVKFADGTTTNLVGRENYFKFLNTADTDYGEFKRFLAQNPEHSWINLE